MVLLQKIKEIGLRNFLSQDEFAKRLGVLCAEAKCWKTVKTVSNSKVLKELDDYCKTKMLIVMFAKFR